jgi:hypothetical protein
LKAARTDSNPVSEFQLREQFADGIWNILYYDTLVRRFEEPKKRITGAPALREKC